MQTAIFTPDSDQPHVLRAAGRVEITGMHWAERGLYLVRNLENGARSRAVGYELSDIKGEIRPQANPGPTPLGLT